MWVCDLVMSRSFLVQNAKCKVKNHDVAQMENVVEDKSFRFAIRVVNMHKYLRQEKREYTMSKQLLRCGTSIGANIAEAQRAQSKADFISKINIALKETVETRYWIKLLTATEYLNKGQSQSIMTDCIELEKILVAILNSSKK